MDYEFKVNKELSQNLVGLFRIWFWDQEIEKNINKKLSELEEELKKNGYDPTNVKYEVEVCMEPSFWSDILLKEMEELMCDGFKMYNYEIRIVFHTHNIWGYYPVDKGEIFLVNLYYGNLRNSAIYEFISIYREYVNSQHYKERR